MGCRVRFGYAGLLAKLSMIKKIAFNIFINIAIIVLVFIIVWSVKNQQYGYTAAGLFSVGIFIYLKIKLVKQVREMTAKGVKSKD